MPRCMRFDQKSRCQAAVTAHLASSQPCLSKSRETDPSAQTVLRSTDDPISNCAQLCIGSVESICNQSSVINPKSNLRPDPAKPHKISRSQDQVTDITHHKHQKHKNKKLFFWSFFLAKKSAQLLQKPVGALLNPTQNPTDLKRLIPQDVARDFISRETRHYRIRFSTVQKQGRLKSRSGKKKLTIKLVPKQTMLESRVKVR